MEEDNLMEVLDEELNDCIEKLRNAVYGYEVRTFITEYEELMLKKSRVITDELLNVIDEAKKKSRQSRYLSMAALTISMVTAIIRVLTVI